MSRANGMKLVPFEMERWQSTWEHAVEFNLSESGVEPLPLRELLRNEAAIDRFLGYSLAYSQGNGTPDKPTGAVMATPQRRAVLDAAKDAGAWLLSDEVYTGAEREAPRTESLWGGYERTLVMNGLSKAYALPGLRIGWVVGPPETIATLWAFHDYTTLTPTYLSDRLAQIALSPGRREDILGRTRSILQRNSGP